MYWTGSLSDPSLPLQNQDSVNTDTVCRLYEVGRQRLAEEEEDEEDQVRLFTSTHPGMNRMASLR